MKFDFTGGWHDGSETTDLSKFSVEAGSSSGVVSLNKTATGDRDVGGEE